MVVFICFECIGIVVAFVFVMLLISFDSKWKILLEGIVGVAGNAAVLTTLFKVFMINDSALRSMAGASLYSGFIIGVIIELFALCRLIKDKDDENIIRIRDILLGQKSYIEKYYKSRSDEIDKRLGLPKLEEKNRELEAREKSISCKEEYLAEQEKRIKHLGNKKVKIELPEKVEVIVTEEFMSNLPSYTIDFFNCIVEINTIADGIFNKPDICLNDLKGYLLSIAMSISKHLFSSSQDIRIHFRYYNLETMKYEKLISLTGSKLSSKSLTPIPYENSMIEKSYELKRALIKSINSDYDYVSANNRVWKDYLTYSYTGVMIDNRPVLSFGISVKNETRFKDIFYYINFIGIENYLNEKIDSFNHNKDIKSLLYEGKEKVND